MSQERTWHHGALTNVAGLSFDEQIQRAGLNWEVLLSPFKYGSDYQYVSGDGTDRKPNSKAVIAYRSDTGEYIDTYRDRTPWQNREILGKFHQFCNEAGLSIDHLGYVGGNVVGSAQLSYEPDVRKVGDTIRYYLLLTDSHKTGRGLNVKLFEHRLVCTNGMTEKIRVANKTISHVGAFDEYRIHQLLDSAMSNTKERHERSEALAGETLSDAEAMIHLIKAFGKPGESIQDQPKEVQAIMNLYKGKGRGSELGSCFNTAYGLLQSVTEYYNWGQKGSYGQKAFASVLDGARGYQMAKFEQQIVGACLR
jgi:hypothetical protein